MAETSEIHIREIVRDELSAMNIPERLAVTEEQNRDMRMILNQEVDRTELQLVHSEIKGEFETIKPELALTQDFMKQYGRITIAFLFGIFNLLIGFLIKLILHLNTLKY